MASISKDKNGTKRIVYYKADKKQASIRLGNVPMKMAETIRVHVRNLLSAQALGQSVCPETAKWLADIPDQLYQKFVDKKFIPPRRVVGTLGEMIPKIIKEKSIIAGAKPATVEIWGQSEVSLYRYFGEDRRVDTITDIEAKEFCVWLAKHGRLKDSGALKQSTVAKRMQHVLSFFLDMVKKGDIPHNPFAGLAKKAKVDERNNLHIPAETILHIMEYAPDAEWRLMIALWRFAGLRAASEVLMLKWEDILWDQKKIVVPSPKTEHHEGKGFRVIPFFPHIERCLTEAFEQAEEGAIYLVEKHAPLYLRGQKERTYISRQGNLGTVFKKIIRRAGIVPWAKLIHNLRASFETDLLCGKYGQFALTTIASWLGHSVKVMVEHYGRIQQSDFDQIEQACVQFNTKKDQTMRGEEAHFVPFLTQNEGHTVEHTVSTPPTKASLNASLYTAVQGELGRNREETPPCSDSTQPFEITALNGKKRQRKAHDANLPNCHSGWRGIRTHGTFPHAGFQDRSLRPLGHPSSRRHSNKPPESVKYPFVPYFRMGTP